MRVHAAMLPCCHAPYKPASPPSGMEQGLLCAGQEGSTYPQPQIGSQAKVSGLGFRLTYREGGEVVLDGVAMA